MKYATKVIYAISNAFNSHDKRMDKIDKTAKKVVNETEKPWPNPEPIKPSYSPVIRLNKNMLPNVLFNYSKDQAYRFNDASAEFVVSSIITCASALIGASCKIAPKQKDKRWTVTQALWCFNIGEPSLLKTPTTRVGVNLVNFAQNEVINPNNIIRENEAKIKEKQIKAFLLKLMMNSKAGMKKLLNFCLNKLQSLRTLLSPYEMLLLMIAHPRL